MGQDLKKFTDTSLNPLENLAPAPVAGPGPLASISSSTLPAPVLGPDVPPAPAAFKADVPTTMDSKVISEAYVKPATLPPALARLQAEQESIAKTGFATPELATAAAQKNADALAAKTAAEKTPPPPTGPTPEDIQALAPEQKGLAEQYKALRESDPTLTASETQLADTNKKLADLQATIDNTEADIRATYGGTLDESAIKAAVNDRLRRVAPEYNRLQRQQAALQTNVENRNGLILQQLGFTQQDIVNHQKSLQDARQNISDLLTTYGSAAFSGMDSAVLAQVEKSAGLPTGFLNRKVQTLREQEAAGKKFEFKEVNGKIFKFEPATGGLVDTGIIVPQDQNAKDQLMFALEVAKAFPGDPEYAANLIKTLSGQGGTGTPSASTNPIAGKTVSSLSDEEMGNLVFAMAKREGFGSADANNRPNRNNNPGDIKVPAGGLAEAKARYGDANVSVDPKPATDGGQFLKFSTPELGLAAMETLLKLPKGPYANQTVDSALKTWSGGAYGADILGGGTETTGTKSLVDIQKGANDAITTNAPKELSDQFAAVLNNVSDRNAPIKIAEFNKRIAAGDIRGAKAYVDDMAKDLMTNTQQQDLTALNDATQNAAIALEDISNFKGTDAGPYKALLERAKSWIGLKQDKKYSKIFASIENFQSNIRRSKFGTALTETEKKTADAFLIKDSDTFPIVLQKLRGLQDVASLSRQRLFLQAKGVFPENYPGQFLVSDPDGGIHAFPSLAAAKTFRDQVKQATGISVF